MKKSSYFNGLLFSLVFGAFTAAAQTSFNSHTFRFSDALEYPTLEGTLSPDEQWVKNRDKLLLRASYDYVDEPVIGLDPSRSNQIATVVESLHTFFLGAGYRFTKRLSAGFDLPLHRVRLNSSFAAGDTSTWSLGDINLRAKFRLTGDQAFVHFAIMPYVYFPTGDAAYLVTDDSYGFGGKILADKHIGRLNLAGHFGYTHASHARYQTIDRSGRFEVGGGALFKITKMFGANGEAIWGITYPDFKKDQNPVELRIGGRVDFGRAIAFVGTGLEAFRGDRSTNYSVYAGVKIPLAKEPPPVEPAVKEVIKEVEVVREVVVKEQVDLLQKTLNLYRQILFEFNKAIIKPQSYGMLDSAAEVIKKYEKQINRIVIEGHTDSIGSREYNLTLSHGRAKAIYEYLISKGVTESKLAFQGYGEDKPVVKEIDEATRQQNRRVEFVVEQLVYDPAEIKENANVIEVPGVNP